MKITASGKIKRHKSNKRHLLSGRTSKRKRQLRRPAIETGRIARKYILALGQ
jgi:ribosomal protein L35